MVGKLGGIFSAPHSVFSQDGYWNEVALVLVLSLTLSLVLVLVLRIQQNVGRACAKN